MKRAFLFCECLGVAPRYVILGESYRKVAKALGGKLVAERICGGVLNHVVFPENLSVRVRKHMKVGEQAKILQYRKGRLCPRKRADVSGGMPHLDEIPILVCKG